MRSADSLGVSVIPPGSLAVPPRTSSAETSPATYSRSRVFQSGNGSALTTGAVTCRFDETTGPPVEGEAVQRAKQRKYVSRGRAIVDRQCMHVASRRENKPPLLRIEFMRLFAALWTGVTNS